MYEYKLTESGAIRLGDMHEMKPDMSDYNWQYFVRWLKAGNIPLPIEAPMPSKDEIQDAKFYEESDVLDDVAHEEAMTKLEQVKNGALKPMPMEKRDRLVCHTCNGKGVLEVAAK